MLKENVTAVIVSYYRPKRLKRCIESLHELENILVYDNNTTGQDLDDIKQLSYPNTNFIFNTENFGLTKAWNTGIIESKTDWVLLTCDDMIFDSDWLPYAKHILSCQYIEPETDEFYERSMVELNKLPDEDVRRLVF